METESIEFKAPEGLEIPEDVKPGGSFEVMATVVLGEEGELYLKEIDGVPIFREATEEEEEKDEDVSQGGFLEAVDRRLAESEE